jgi:hypothetical protein
MLTTKGGAKQSVAMCRDRMAMQSAKMIAAHRSALHSAVKSNAAPATKKPTHRSNAALWPCSTQAFPGGKIPASGDDRRHDICRCRVKQRTRNRCPPATCTPHR